MCERSVDGECYSVSSEFTVSSVVDLRGTMVECMVN